MMLDTEEKMGCHAGRKPYCDGREVVTPLRERDRIRYVSYGHLQEKRLWKERVKHPKVCMFHSLDLGHPGSKPIDLASHLNLSWKVRWGTEWN